MPGEFTQHDCAEVDVRFLDGSRRRIHLLASRPGYSRFVLVPLVPDEPVESLIRNLVDHFEAMGGVRRPAVFDRPKTVAIACFNGSRWRVGSLRPLQRPRDPADVESLGRPWPSVSSK